MALKPIEVATIGDNCIDRYRGAVNQDTYGGNAVNVAVHLSRLGRSVAYYGAVGSDDAGQRTLEILASQGLELKHCWVLPGVTSYTDLRVEQGGNRVIVFEEFGVCADYMPTQAELALMKGLRHVHIGWMKDAAPVRAALAELGLSISQDCAVSMGYDGLDIALCSAGEDIQKAEALAGEATRGGAKLAVVTCGALGSLAFDGQSWWRTHAAPTEVVDTTGAGDTFIAAFIHARLSGHDVQACLEAGRDAAAITCTHIGGWPRLRIAKR